MENKPSVLFLDNHIIVTYKPYGVLSESDEHKSNMPALLREECGCDTIFTVHRLDRTTQGLMVYAKTQEAARRLNTMVQRGEVVKNYLAVIEGKPDPRAGEMTDLLYFDRRKNKSYVVKRERKGVKEACLTYETLQTEDVNGTALSLVKVRLVTGRTHQIRVQFASRRLPLAGDRRYGSRIACENIHLCASELQFNHPFSGEEMYFSYEPTNEYFGMIR